MNRDNQSGFSIVELLVVIVVIGILAAITIVSYTGITQRATISSLMSDLDSFSKILKLDQIQDTSEDYPADLSLANNGKGISSNSNDLLYDVNNNTNPKSFCLTAKKDATSYFITNDTIPALGDCLSWGLVGHWAMDEGSGTNAIDSSGLNRNGTWSGTGAHFALGKVGAYSGQFATSNNDFIDINPIAAYRNTSETSYSFWNIPTGASGDFAIIHYGSQLCQSSTTNIRCWVNTSNQSVTYSRVATSNWEHVVVTISFITNTVKFYINGQLMQTDAITVTVNPTTRTSIYVGQYNGSRRFSGQIDDARVYDRIISDSTIQALYNL